MKTWKTALLVGTLSLTALHAQTTPPLTVTSTGTNPVDFQFRADGTLISKGNFGVGSLLSTDQGAGTRMLWFPAKGAFRAGAVSDTKWDASNIGSYSTAWGNRNLASGEAATAMGADSSATGPYSTAIGWGCTASGYASIAMGLGASASFGGSMAMGFMTHVSGGWSTAMGYATYANNYSCTALGDSTIANGGYSTAIGSSTIANGTYSTSMGRNTVATSENSLAVGRMNIGGGNSGQWVPTDPLLEVGNGDPGSPSSNWQQVRSNALTVYKNGNVTVQGVITSAPGGDIPMFDGN